MCNFTYRSRSRAVAENGCVQFTVDQIYEPLFHRDHAQHVAVLITPVHMPGLSAIDCASVHPSVGWAAVLHRTHTVLHRTTPYYTVHTPKLQDGQTLSSLDRRTDTQLTRRMYRRSVGGTDVRTLSSLDRRADKQLTSGWTHAEITGQTLRSLDRRTDTQFAGQMYRQTVDC